MYVHTYIHAKKENQQHIIPHTRLLTRSIDSNLCRTYVHTYICMYVCVVLRLMELSFHMNPKSKCGWNYC